MDPPSNIQVDIDGQPDPSPGFIPAAIAGEPDVPSDFGASHAPNGQLSRGISVSSNSTPDAKSGGTRTIWVNNRIANIPSNFIDNYISTTRYTYYNFIPKNLLEQFRRVSNVFFLFNAIVALFPSISPVTPATAILPLVFVLGVAALNDAVEDFQRYKGDQRANNALTQIVFNDGVKPDGTKTFSLKTVLSHNISVGDLVLVTSGNHIPCDLVCLGTSDPEGSCYIETSNLDGETNLKQRSAPFWLSKCTSRPQDFYTLRAQVKCQAPSMEMYRFEGRLQIHDPNVFLEQVGFDHDPDREVDMMSMGSNTTGMSSPGNDPQSNEFEGKTIPLSRKQILLRGSSLRNTSWAIGVAVYTGRDTKLYQNLNQTPSKFSRLDMRLNQVVFSLLCVDLLILLICATSAATTFTSETIEHWYIFPENANPDASKTSPGEIFSLRLLTFFVIFSFIVPISLFVTITLVRVAQKRFMEWDLHLHLDPQDPSSAMVINNSNINEELGIVGHIFADKTGTLTQNDMSLVHWSIGGKLFDEAAFPGILETILSGSVDPTTPRAIQQAQSTSQTKEAIEKFLRIIVTCHSVVPELTKRTRELIYQSQSPDETALIQAASSSGFELLARKNDLIIIGRPTRNRVSGESLSLFARDSESSTLTADSSSSLNEMIQEYSGQLEQYKVVANLEFTSERKIMSVIVRAPNDKLYLWTKGADSAILPRAAPGDPLLSTIDSHVSLFARQGLRTLVIAERELTENEFQTWKREFDRAQASVQHRKKRVSRVCRKLEHSFRILGCTAVEDRLQRNVPETISFLIDAGIHVWLLTGDKQETAINIGLSSKLIAPSNELIILNANDEEEFHTILDAAMINYFSDWNPDTQIASTKIPNFAAAAKGRSFFGHPHRTRSFNSAASSSSDGSHDSTSSVAPSVLSKFGQILLTFFRKLSGTDIQNQCLVPEYTRREHIVQVGAVVSEKPDEPLHKPPVHPSIRPDNNTTDNEVDTELSIMASISEDGNVGKIPIVDEEISPNSIVNDPNAPSPSPTPLKQSSVENDPTETSSQKKKTVTIKNKRLSLIIDGRSLQFALEHRSLDLLALAGICETVICCRVTPIQKAFVVKLGKEALGRVCLAVGDGANDVSMIQEANVGVGIIGREGTQAARASDYAIGEFRHLQRLLAVHGRWNIFRLANLIHYSMYKNAAFILPQLYFNIWSMWSGQLIYDEWMATTQNIFYTALPPFILGILSKDLSELTVLENPILYKTLRSKEIFNLKTMSRWFLLANYHALVFFFLCLLTFHEGVLDSSALSYGHFIHASIQLTCVLFVVILQAALLIDNWTYLTHFAVWGSMASYCLFFYLYSSTALISSFANGEMYLSFSTIFSMPLTYLLMILTAVVALFPVLGHQLHKLLNRPTNEQIILNIYKRYPERIFDIPGRLPRYDIQDHLLEDYWKENRPEFYSRWLNLRERQQAETIAKERANSAFAFIDDSEILKSS